MAASIHYLRDRTAAHLQPRCHDRDDPLAFVTPALSPEQQGLCARDPEVFRGVQRNDVEVIVAQSPCTASSWPHEEASW